MSYKLVKIENGEAVDSMDLESIQVIPPGGTLLFTVNEYAPDADFEYIKQEIRNFFADHKCAIIRAGDMQVIGDVAEDG